MTSEVCGGSQGGDARACSGIHPTEVWLDWRRSPGCTTPNLSEHQLFCCKMGTLTNALPISKGRNIISKDMLLNGCMLNKCEELLIS